ncbi:MAG TPA: DUF4397 domain-containing protein, partial [Nannocystaceae bacterium]|nr:DUF4397 domain-containing protein [Nannocystaceae bacterium]
DGESSSDDAGDVGDPTDDSADDDGDGGDGDDGDGTTGGPAGPGDAEIRIIHGAPDAPAVDIYVAGDNEPVVTGLAYGQASDYLVIPAGTYDFQVRAAGASPLDAPVYSTGDLDVPAGASISALAAGLLDTDGNNAFRVIPLVEGFDDAQPGQARVRIVHAGSDAPSVDLDVGNDGIDEIDDLMRFTETGAGGVALPAGVALRLGIRVDGATVTTFTTPELPDGGELIVVATGLLGKLPREADGFALLAIGPEGAIGFVKQDPTVYALHAGADAPEVDLCVGNTALATHFGFGEMKSTQVSPGSYDVDAYAAPSGCAGSPAISDTTPDLVAGERYLVVATGELAPAMGEPPLQLEAYRDDLTLGEDDSAVFRLVHAASAPVVDVGIVTGGMIENGNVLAAALKWPGESDELMVQPLTYQIGIASAGQPTPILPLLDFHVPVEAGQRLFVVAAGDAFPEGLEAHFRLLAVDTAASPWTVGAIDPN